MLLVIAAWIPMTVLSSEPPIPYSAYLAQRSAWNQEHYTKIEVYIPMRDGKKLFTVIFSPKDISKSYPILMNRTPYAQDGYGPNQPSATMGWFHEKCFAEDGFIFVGQDVRGRFMSASGDFVDVRPINPAPKQETCDESTDTYDTIAWLLANAQGNNGKVGIYGQSYDGFYAASALVRHHPALKAAILSAPVTDWWDGDDIHRNGALRLAQTLFFYRSYMRPQATVRKEEAEWQPPTPDSYSYLLGLGPLSELAGKVGIEPGNFWNEILRHPDRDQFGKARDLRPHLQGIKAKVLSLGGWFDNENLFGALNTYKTIKAQAPNAGNGIVLGPWVHGNWRAPEVRNPAREDGDRLGAGRTHDWLICTDYGISSRSHSRPFPVTPLQ